MASNYDCSKNLVSEIEDFYQYFKQSHQSEDFLNDDYFCLTKPTSNLNFFHE